MANFFGFGLQIQAMQEQLQEEMNINVALSNIIEQNTSEKIKSHHHLPDEVLVLVNSCFSSPLFNKQSILIYTFIILIIE